VLQRHSEALRKRESRLMPVGVDPVVRVQPPVESKTLSRRLQHSNPAIEIEYGRRSTCGNEAPQPSVRLDAFNRGQASRLRPKSTFATAIGVKHPQNLYYQAIA